MTLSATAFPPVRPGDAAAMPRGEDQFVWSQAQKIIAHRNMQRLFPSAVIHASGRPRDLEQGKPIDPTYSHDGETFSVESYLRATGSTGLIVLKKGRIVLERYSDELDENTLWASRSMAKSVTATLIGIAINEGAIGSVDDPVIRYVPELAGTLYDGVSLRQLLRMTASVPYTEDTSDPASDIFGLQACTTGNRKGAFLEFLIGLGSRPSANPSAPGSVFNYSTADSVLCGLVLERALGGSVPAYLEAKIWKPCGMEKDAYWNLEAEGGSAFTGSGIGATLRDYARFGQFVLAGCALPDGTRLVGERWMDEALTASAPSIAERSPYGFQWWLHNYEGCASVTAGGADPMAPEAAPITMRGGESMFYALGSAGQAIAINPAEEVVIVKLAVWPGHRVDRWRYNDAALYAALIEACA